jgi:beta-glucosidase
MQQRHRALRLEILTGFESTYAPRFDSDVAETTQHVARRPADLDLLAASGVRHLRYPIRWHRVEAVENHFEWRETDEAFQALTDRNLSPIVDLMHHTSHPAWLTFDDPRFRSAYLRYVEAFACRYPWIESYTLFNEPFSTLLLSGQEGIWPPYLKGLAGIVSLWRNVLPAWSEASRMYRQLLPRARHIHTDTCERHSGDSAYAPLANDRRLAVLDLLLGIDLDPKRPFFREMVKAGGEELLHMERGHVDVVGLDYYAHNQWHFDVGAPGCSPTPYPVPLADLIQEYWLRYQRPCLLTETNIRGTGSDRATWFKYTLEQCERAASKGVPIEGHCWFPFVDSCDWASLLRRRERHLDPVGVYFLDDELERQPSSISKSFAMAAAGCTSENLPAYEFQRPVSHWLRGWLPQMAHWDWQLPPEQERIPEVWPTVFQALGASTAA